MPTPSLPLCAVLTTALVLTLVPITANAQTVPASGEIVQLKPFEVMSDRGTRGYATTNVLGATRVNASVADTPESVISLNQEFLRDINPDTLGDVLRFVSGVTKTDGEYTGNVTIRGVTTSAVGYRDGIPDNLTANVAGGGLAVLPDPIEVERLEVIKGPAGVLYGSTGFGGIINRVSKRPQETARTEVGFNYNYFDDGEGYYRGTLDTMGPIDADKHWLYRAVAAYQDGTTHQHGRNKRSTVIGTLEYHPDANTATWFRVRHSEDSPTSLQDLWTDNKFNDPWGYLPRYAFVGNYWNNDESDSVRAQAYEWGITRSFEAVGARWNARVLARYNDVRAQHRAYIDSGSLFYRNGAPLVVNGVALTTANSTWAAAAAAGYDDIRENVLRRDIRNGDQWDGQINFDLTASFSLGPTQHQILLYAGQSEGELKAKRFRENWIGPKPSVFYKTEIDPTQVLDGKPQTLAGEWSDTSNKLFNFAIQDNISILNDRLIAVGAARYDDGTSGVFDHVANAQLPEVKQLHWTPTYGLVGKPLQGVSLFAIHSETFQPQGGVNQAGERLKPLIANNNEVGLKLDLLRDRIVLTGSHFDMTQQNAPLKIIHLDGSFDFIQIPESYCKGWETDIALQPVDRLTLLIAYQWLDARTTGGLQLKDVPEYGTYKGVVRYSLLKNLNVGVTYEHINDTRAGDAPNTFFNPGYDLTGLFANYTWKNWRVQINVENLTNEWYIVGSSAQQFIRSGPPRAIKLGATHTF
jgi:iron complex outermembrane receptor protein